MLQLRSQPSAHLNTLFSSVSWVAEGHWQCCLRSAACVTQCGWQQFTIRWHVGHQRIWTPVNESGWTTYFASERHTQILFEWFSSVLIFWPLNRLSYWWNNWFTLHMQPRCKAHMRLMRHISHQHLHVKTHIPKKLGAGSFRRGDKLQHWPLSYRVTTSYVFLLVVCLCKCLFSEAKKDRREGCHRYSAVNHPRGKVWVAVTLTPVSVVKHTVSWNSPVTGIWCY